jgi:glycogen operon protein
MTINFLAIGTPMLLMGDEARRTQLGNNNAYCQNNEISWFDWSLLERNGEIFRFVQQLIRLRRRFAIANEGRTLSLTEFLRRAEFRFHGVHQDEPDWGDESHSLAITLKSANAERLIHFIFNAWWKPLRFQLPLPLGLSRWQRLIDTSLPRPFDIADATYAVVCVDSPSYSVQPRSTVVLSSEASKSGEFARSGKHR